MKYTLFELLKQSYEYHLNHRHNGGDFNILSAAATGRPWVLSCVYSFISSRCTVENRDLPWSFDNSWDRKVARTAFRLAADRLPSFQSPGSCHQHLQSGQRCFEIWQCVPPTCWEFGCANRRRLSSSKCASAETLFTFYNAECAN